MASEPVATFMDPPVGLRAELRCHSDVVQAVGAAGKTGFDQFTRGFRVPDLAALQHGVAGSFRIWSKCRFGPPPFSRLRAAGAAGACNLREERRFERKK